MLNIKQKLKTKQSFMRDKEEQKIRNLQTVNVIIWKADWKEDNKRVMLMQEGKEWAWGQFLMEK